MVRIDLNAIHRSDKERNKVHNQVEATYSVFEIAGEKYVQLDTYGEADRKTPSRASQIIQIDKNTAKYLVDLLKREFDI